jgi:hypothetical protein
LLIDDNNSSAYFKFKNLFPCDISRCVDHYESLLNENTFIHGVSSKASLSQLFTSLLYDIFPIDLNLLYEEDLLPKFLLTTWIHETIHSSSSNNNTVFDENTVVCANKKWFNRPIHFVSTINTDKLNMNEVKEKLFFESYEAFPFELHGNESLHHLWQFLKATVKTILDNLDCSIFPAIDATPGCDSIMLLKGVDENGNINENDIHIVAIELKDSPSTSSEQWNEKFKLLTSIRCIVPFLKTGLEKLGKTLTYHIVFVGREHGYEKKI